MTASALLGVIAMVILILGLATRLSPDLRGLEMVKRFVVLGCLAWSLVLLGISFYLTRTWPGVAGCAAGLAFDCYLIYKAATLG